MFTTVPTSVASVTATTVADAPGASRPRLHVNGLQTPWEGVSEINLVRNERGSSTLRPFTSAAATVELFVTVIVHVMRPPTRTTVGCADFVTTRSSSGPGGGRDRWLGRFRGIRRFRRVRRLGRLWSSRFSGS